MQRFWSRLWQLPERSSCALCALMMQLEAAAASNHDVLPSAPIATSLTTQCRHRVWLDSLTDYMTYVRDSKPDAAEEPYPRGLRQCSHSAQ
eukprot:14675-Heterococcus_DN1.PRE.7